MLSFIILYRAIKFTIHQLAGVYAYRFIYKPKKSS